MMRKELEKELSSMPKIISEMYAAVKTIKETTDFQEAAQLVDSKEWIVLGMFVKEGTMCFSLGRIR